MRVWSFSSSQNLRYQQMGRGDCHWFLSLNKFHVKWDKYQSIQCSIYHPYSLLCSFLLCYLERLESCSIFNTKIVGNIWLIPSVLSSKEEGGRPALKGRLLKDPIGSALSTAASQMNKSRWLSNLNLFEISWVATCRCHRFQCLSDLIWTKMCLERDRA